MKLTETHIQELYKFTKKHYVEYYDVQTELVDHLANDIEEIWTAYPTISFEDARNKSFKKFGIFGFMDVIEAKQKQMNKRYMKIIWRFFKEWFTMPKLMTTIALFLSIFMILKIQYSERIVLGVILCLCIFDIIQRTIRGKKEKIKIQKKEKTFLLETLIGQTRNGFSSLMLINMFNIINGLKVPFHSLDTLWMLFISLSVTFLIILFYVTGYLIPQKAEELLEETYPEYKLSKSL